MFDVTSEHAISEIKSALISNTQEHKDDLFMLNLQETLFQKDLRDCFSVQPK